MKRAIFTGILAVLFAVGASAQAKPNFAGTWTLDAEKSTMPQGGGNRGGGNPAPLTIVVEGPKMSISRTMGQAGTVQTTVFMLDGTDSKNMMPGRQGGEPTEILYKSKWDGAKLVTTITNPRGTSTESRWMEADGTMVVETTRTGQDGTPMTSKLVYKKG
ncbi:MAG: hypothetical protein M3R55_08225 [Acidobacteriota bacterium]|nr:hypothetical protein [Acidobacteriota bacterium]